MEFTGLNVVSIITGSGHTFSQCAVYRAAGSCTKGNKSDSRGRITLSWLKKMEMRRLYSEIESLEMFKARVRFVGI